MDYGTNNNSIANTTIETTRAFTGHEQIAELSGLIHMNARVYDSDIGRFLSADPIIQDPNDSQSYNRYSYVRNNPLVFTDPSGHSWLSKLWKKVKKWARTIASIIVAAVIVAGTMGYGLLAPWLAGMNTIAAGALAGAASGAIMTGSLEGALTGALWGAIGVGVALGIGHGIGLEGAGNLFEKGVDAGKLFIKSALHGLSRGIISIAQGGTFRSGFASGFSASFFSPGTTGNGGFVGRTSIAAIVGGTASSLGGGKFSNGAVSGAFVHMFNAENVLKKLTFTKAREHYIENSGKQLSVDASSVDLSKVNKNIFSGIGDMKPIQLFFHGNEYSSFNDALTYGSINLVYVGGNEVGIMPDYYDFDMQSWSTSTIRNLGTIGGRILNMDPMGTASGYSINFVGTATIGGN